jgi:hypothetical protein
MLSAAMDCCNACFVGSFASGIDPAVMYLFQVRVRVYTKIEKCFYDKNYNSNPYSYSRDSSVGRGGLMEDKLTKCLDPFTVNLEM